MTMTLPKTVEGLGGPITVRIRDDLSDMDGALGRFHAPRRIIEIQSGLEEATLVATFYHELFHAALYDSGQHHDFDEKGTERLCDLTGSMMGRLKGRP